MFMHIESYIGCPITKIQLASTSKDMRKIVKFDKLVNLHAARNMSQEFMHSDLIQNVRELLLYENCKVIDIRHLTNLEALYCRRSSLRSDGIIGLGIKHLEIESVRNKNEYYESIDKIYQLPKLESCIHDKRVLFDLNRHECILCILCLVALFLFCISVVIMTFIGIPLILSPEAIYKKTNATFTLDTIVREQTTIIKCSLFVSDCMNTTIRSLEPTKLLDLYCQKICKYSTSHDLYTVSGRLKYTVSGIEYNHIHIFSANNSNAIVFDSPVYFRIDSPNIYSETEIKPSSWIPYLYNIVRFQTRFAPIMIVLAIIFYMMSNRRAEKNGNVLDRITANRIKGSKH